MLTLTLALALVLTLALVLALTRTLTLVVRTCRRFSPEGPLPATSWPPCKTSAPPFPRRRAALCAASSPTRPWISESSTDSELVLHVKLIAAMNIGIFEGQGISFAP